jgi:hypothetical protein
LFSQNKVAKRDDVRLISEGVVLMFKTAAKDGHIAIQTFLREVRLPGRELCKGIALPSTHWHRLSRDNRAWQAFDWYRSLISKTKDQNRYFYQLIKMGDPEKEGEAPYRFDPYGENRKSNAHMAKYKR